MSYVTEIITLLIIITAIITVQRFSFESYIKLLVSQSCLTKCGLVLYILSDHVLRILLNSGYLHVTCFIHACTCS
jgi:hypothetical protein